VALVARVRVERSCEGEGVRICLFWEVHIMWRRAREEEWGGGKFDKPEANQSRRW
jgi:hypothetical protein